MSRLSLFRVASSLHILYSPAGQLLPVERWHYFDILGPTRFFSGRQIGEDQRRGERDRERRECHQRGRPLYRPHPHRHRLLARSQPKEQQQVLGDSLAFCLLRYFLRLVYVYPLIPQIHYTVYITRLLHTLFRPPFGNTKNPPVKIRKIQKTNTYI